MCSQTKDVKLLKQLANNNNYDIAYDIKRIWYFMQLFIKKIVILFKIWCEKLMSITLHITCV